jgi:glycosyltransferase involved in cell wall biosynthesis
MIGKMRPMKLIIYMPALNEEAHIQMVLASLPGEIAGVDEIVYLVVDDGSADNTATLAKNSGAEVIRHTRNRGVGAAFHSAVQFALENNADILVGIDADGQFSSEEIPALINPILQNKANMVIGNRFSQGIPTNMPPLKFWGNQQVAAIVNYVTGQSFQDVSCGFRAYDRESLLRLNLFAEFTYTHESILSVTFQGLNVVEQPISVRYDPERKSRVAGSILRYAVQTSKIILRVLLDYRPIRVFGSFGGICIGIGAAFEIFLIGHYIFTGSFSPYKATGFIGLSFIIFGLLVLVIALVSDMLNRIRINQEKLLYETKKSNIQRIFSQKIRSKK